MNCVHFRLQISSEDYLRYYAGQAKKVSVVSEDGRRIEFPAEHLRQFILADGINGYLELCFVNNNRFSSLNKIK